MKQDEEQRKLNCQASVPPPPNMHVISLCVCVGNICAWHVGGERRKEGNGRQPEIDEVDGWW
jgi:hypothetical protein